MSYYKNSEARKCCQELNKRKKMMEMNLRSESMGSELFVFLFNFHVSYLREWREEYSDDIINCPSCSHFRDKLPIGMFIELDFVSLGNINIADQPFLPNYKPRQIIKQTVFESKKVKEVINDIKQREYSSFLKLLENNAKQKFRQ